MPLFGSTGEWLRLPLPNLYWRLNLPPDVLGLLDWASGVILLNDDYETFQRAESGGARTEEERELLRTVVHEVTHYYQVLLTGYLYQHVNQLASLVSVSLLKAHGSAPFDSDEQIIQVIDELPAGVPDIHMRALSFLMTELRQPGRHGLSALDIAEGHASFVELRYREDCDAARFAELLADGAISPGYRAAYDAAREQLGNEAAFRWFSLACCLALCSSHPVLSFGRLLDRLASGAAHLPDGRVNVADLIEKCCGYRYLGSPLDLDSAISADLPKLRTVTVWVSHYQAALAVLREEQKAGRGLDLIGFFGEPYSQLTELTPLVAPMVLPNPTPAGEIVLWRGRPADSEAQTYEALSWAVACRQLLANVDLESTPTARPGPPAEDVRTLLRDSLQAARQGDAIGYFNLGLNAMEIGHKVAARAWWHLGVLSGDAESSKALAIAYSDIGDEERASHFFDAISRRIYGRFEIEPASLMQLGEEAEQTDSDAAEECFRAAASMGEARGAWLYGSRVVSRDPLEGLAYLALAAGSDSPEAALADNLINRLRESWGPEIARARMTEALARLEELERSS